MSLANLQGDLVAGMTLARLPGDPIGLIVQLLPMIVDKHLTRFRTRASKGTPIDQAIHTVHLLQHWRTQFTRATRIARIVKDLDLLHPDGHHQSGEERTAHRIRRILGYILARGIVGYRTSP